MSTILKECKKALKGKSYLWFPDGRLIPRAKGYIEMNEIKPPHVIHGLRYETTWT